MRFVKLSDAYHLQMGKTPSRSNSHYWGPGNQWVSISDLGKCTKYISMTKESITDDAIKESGIKPVPRGTLIMSFKLSIGKTAITANNMYTNEAIMAFFDKKTYEIDINYMYHLFCNWNWLGGSNKAVLGLTLNKATLADKRIPLPEISDQRRIATLFDEVDQLISLRQQQAEKLDELVKARFVEMFGDPVRNTKQFPLVELQDLYDVSSSKRVYQDEMVLSGIPFLRISDIVEKSTNDKCTPQCFISQEMYDQLSQKGLTPNVGDILVTSRGTLGLCYEVKPGEKFYFQDGMISWLYNRKDCVINTYLLYAFRMPGIRKQIDGSNDGSTVSYLSIARLKRLKIELPPLALQTEFSHFVHEVDREKERIQRSAALLATLKRSLMQQYFG